MHQLAEATGPDIFVELRRHHIETSSRVFPDRAGENLRRRELCDANLVAPDTLAKLQLTVNDIANAIAAQTSSICGRLGDEPRSRSGIHLQVRAQAMTGRRPVRRYYLRANPTARCTPQDVGRIELGAQSYTQQATTNGAPSAVILLYQNPDRTRWRQPPRRRNGWRNWHSTSADMQSVLTLDTTFPITEGAREIAKTLLEAIALVVLWCSSFCRAGARRSSRSLPFQSRWSARSFLPRRGFHHQ